VLEQYGDDLTRENVMKEAANLDLDMLPPGASIHTTPTSYYPQQQMQMEKFEGTRWQRFGPNQRRGRRVSALPCSPRDEALSGPFLARMG
jgi:hypothetical protein